MATTAACSIKATAMCLLWMVFLSASTAGKREEDEFAQQLAFSNLGAYGDANGLLANKEKFVKLQWYVRCMSEKVQPIYGNLEPKLSRGDYLVNEKDLMDLIDLRILVTKEKLPWRIRQLPAPECLPCTKNFAIRRAEYNKYLELFNKCVVLFQTRMSDVATKLNEAYNNLKPKFDSGAYLGDEPDMETIQGIVSHEVLLWGNDPEDWTQPHSHSENVIFLQYKEAYVKSSRLINAHDQKYGGYTTHLHESPMDTARQGTTNHGNQNSMVTSGVAEPIASNQQWPLFTSDGYAGMSHGSTYADRSEFGYIPGFDLGQPYDTATMRHYADPSGYGISTEYYHAYTGDDSSIEGTTSFAHPPTYAPAGPSSPYAETGTPYPLTYAPAGPSSPYGTGVSYPFPTIDPANPSEYGYSNPPSGSKRLKRRSAVSNH
ncbi:hypothetical protein SeLEV6574_g07042 [Synchytrium endobioticum]|uniref:Uncharacterized protein n=1 Tax=Synchytrium endobioticum TaxID=286115 RepID=A0A507CJL1_9FUNG|nr:hypothetical protein SeLEV6574_g07042 [Synchytrium endobioticum]